MSLGAPRGAAVGDGDGERRLRRDGDPPREVPAHRQALPGGRGEVPVHRRDPGRAHAAGG